MSRKIRLYHLIVSLMVFVVKQLTKLLNINISVSRINRFIHSAMDIIISEPYDSIWSSSDCSSSNTNISTITTSRDFFYYLPVRDPDLVTILLLIGKIILYCIGLYAIKLVLYFAYWLLFLPFDWTKVMCFLYLFLHIFEY